ncbi:MAG: DUF6152 family protein [Steroidobacteraceae bacterium]
MNTNFRFVLVALGMIGAASVSAHHAVTAVDQSRTITIEGTIKTYQWTNPHVWIWVLVPDKNGGEAKVWGIESANLSMARRMGMNKDSFKAGDKVVMVINPMRDGREGGTFRKATFPDGHTVDMGMPGGGPAAETSAPAKSQ